LRADGHDRLAHPGEIMKEPYHKPYIQHPRCRQKRRSGRARLRFAPIAAGVLLAALLALPGCDPVQIVEGSDTHVSIRYDGVANGLDQATALARTACARYGRTARLRRTYHEGLGLGERFAFFDCV
jgi:hypothetical protein